MHYSLYLPACSNQYIPINWSQHLRCVAVSSYGRHFSVWAVKDKWWEIGGSAVSNKEQSVKHLCSIKLHQPWARRKAAVTLATSHVKSHCVSF